MSKLDFYLTEWSRLYIVLVLVPYQLVFNLFHSIFQINFFKDHTKIILCPLMGAVTYIDENRKARTFRLDLIEKYGCCSELATRLIYTFEKVENMIKSTSRRTATAE